MFHVHTCISMALLMKFPKASSIILCLAHPQHHIGIGLLTCYKHSFLNTTHTLARQDQLCIILFCRVCASIPQNHLVVGINFRT